jgi:hypothetical protein
LLRCTDSPLFAVLAVSAWVFSGAEVPVSAFSFGALVRVLPVSDEELFKRLKSMTMLKTSGNLDACHVLGHSLENFRLTLQ